MELFQEQPRYKRVAAVALYGATIVVPRVTTAFLAIFYARTFTLGEYGIYGVLIAALTAVLCCADLGVPAGMLRNFYRCGGEADKQRAYIGGVMAASRRVALLILPLVCLGLWALWDLVGVGSSFAAGYVLLFLLLAYIDRSIEVFAVICRALERPELYALGRFSYALGLVVAAAILVWILHLGIVGALLALLVARIVAAAVYRIVLRAEFGIIATRPDWRDFRACLDIGLPLTVHRYASWAKDVALRPVLIHLVPVAQVGLFSLAGAVAALPMMATSAVDLAFAPLYFRKRALNDDDFRPKVRMLATLGMAILFPVWVFMVAFSTELITFFAGPRYAAAAPACAILLCASFLRTQHTYFIRQIQHLNKAWLNPCIITACAVLALTVAILASPSEGILAAAWGLCLADSLALLFWAIAIRHFEPLDYPLRNAFLFVGLLVGSAAWVSAGRPTGGEMSAFCLQSGAVLSALMISFTFFIWPNRRVFLNLTRN